MQRRTLLALRREAQARGIQTSYLDNTGKEQVASEETLRLILECLGPLESTPAERRIEPVTVCWQKKRGKLVLRLPSSELKEALLRLRLEGEEEESIPIREIGGLQQRTAPSGGLAEMTLDVPELPTGYHSVLVESASGIHESMLISAPAKLFSEKTRQWGAFLPMYAAHSERSWGAGNFSDYGALCEWLGSLGGKVIGSLPLLSAFLDSPVCEPSPYSPSSRLFWNEFFIDIAAIPEFQRSSEARRLAGSTGMNRQIAAFRFAEFIDYKEQWQARRRILEVLARDFFKEKPARWVDFNAYLRARPEVEDYALFRAACDRSGLSWRAWTQSAADATPPEYSADVRNFYLYIQWVAQQQMDDLLKTCKRSGVKFYLDLPLGVNPDGFDAWRYQDFFASRTSAGAPPDSFFTKGQDWGFAPLHPERIRALKYRYVIDYLRFQMRHTGLLRIDHVMGLHRLWWVPRGAPASAGAYVRYPAEELYAILSVESHRHRTTLVGENLGTVPPEVNESMDRHGLRRMYVLQYEEQPKGTALRNPEASVVASLNTHDMPSFAAHWKGLDIDDRANLGLVKDLAKEKAARETMRQFLIAFLRKNKLLRTARPKTEEVLEAVLRFLAKSPAETVLVTLEDLWGEELPQNVPGTMSERPNWKRKAARTVDELRADRGLRDFLTKVMQR